MLSAVDTTAGYRRRTIQLMVVLALSVSGCGIGADDGEAAPAETTADTSSSTTTANTGADPSASTGTEWCPSQDEVSAIVGHAVTQGATGGFSGSDQLSISYSGCSYGGDGNDYTIARATIETEKDGPAFDLLAEEAQGAVAESGFSVVDGLGDDAYLDGQTLVFRTGDTVVFLGGAAEDGSDIADRRDALAKALTTIDLSDDEAVCTAPADAVTDAFGPVSDTRIGGGVTAVDDVTIDTVSCTFAADDSIEVTLSVADAGSWDDWVAAKASSPFTASYEPSSIVGRAAFDTGAELIVDDGDKPLRIETSTPGISGEDVTALRVGLAELVLAG